VLPRHGDFADIEPESPGQQKALHVESARDPCPHGLVQAIGSVHDELIQHGKKLFPTPGLEPALSIGERKAEQHSAEEHLPEAQQIPLRRGARSRKSATADGHIRAGPGCLEQQGAFLDRGGQIHVRHQHDLTARRPGPGAQGGRLAAVTQFEHFIGRLASQTRRIVYAAVIRNDQFHGEGTGIQPVTHHVEHSGLNGRTLVVGRDDYRQRDQVPIPFFGLNGSDQSAKPAMSDGPSLTT